MSLIHTYGTLWQTLQNMAEDFNTDYQAMLPEIIQKGELRVIRDLDLANLDYTMATGAISQTTGLVTQPTNLIRARTVQLNNGTANVGIVQLRSYDFINSYLLGAAGTTGVPKYFGNADAVGVWQVAPIPSAAYTLNVNGIYPPVTIADNPGPTNLAAIAAAQALVGGTAMTLTTSPYVVSGEPIPVSLTSASGTLAGITFTIVGLDSDGNTMTVTIAGPNSGTVSTVNFFSQINSITPSATNAATMSVGYTQTNTTWMSTRFADLLEMSCFIDANHYLKRFSAREIAKTEYAARLSSAAALIRTLKRTDIDDIVMGRQNQSIPGAQPNSPQTEGTAQLGPKLTGI